MKVGCKALINFKNVLIKRDEEFFDIRRKSEFKRATSPRA
jgi:hypothetical protein